MGPARIRWQRLSSLFELLAGRVCVILVFAVLSLDGLDAMAAGSSVSRPYDYYQSLRRPAMNGGRAEILDCLKAADAAISSDAHYQKIDWSQGINGRLMVTEILVDGVVMVDAEIDSLGLIRDDSFIHFDAWETVHIACHQLSGGKPQVAIGKADPH